MAFPLVTLSGNHLPFFSKWVYFEGSAMRLLVWKAQDTISNVHRKSSIRFLAGPHRDRPRTSSYLSEKVCAACFIAYMATQACGSEKHPWERQDTREKKDQWSLSWRCSIRRNKVFGEVEGRSRHCKTNPKALGSICLATQKGTYGAWGMGVRGNWP